MWIITFFPGWSSRSIFIIYSSGNTSFYCILPVLVKRWISFFLYFAQLHLFNNISTFRLTLLFMVSFNTFFSSWSSKSICFTHNTSNIYCISLVFAKVFRWKHFFLKFIQLYLFNGIFNCGLNLLFMAPGITSLFNSFFSFLQCFHCNFTVTCKIKFILKEIEKLNEKCT